MEYAPESEAPAPGPEAAPEPSAPALPPDTGDAIQQMNALMAEGGLPLGRGQEGLSAEEVEAARAYNEVLDGLDGYQEPELGADPAEEGYDYEDGIPPDPEEALNQLVDDRVRQTLEPVFERQETERRETAILGLAERYPRLRDPEVLADVGGALDQAAEVYGNPAMRNDPHMVEIYYLAHEAMRAASNGEQFQPPASGAAIETGAGPSAPTEPGDPVENAWIRALNGDVQAEDIIG